MPAERPEPRRSSRKLASDEDVELKRAKGEISCAECRRLKLKCDKKVPCGSCVRRGCTTICPNGSLSAGQGTRFILADTEQLHGKISQMSERIRQLEDALSIHQSGVSEERHPLLRDDLLSIKYGLDVRPHGDEEHLKKKVASTIDALGTLTLGEHGETKFIGRSGGSETWFLKDAESPDHDLQADPEEPKLEEDIDNVAFTFPFQLPIIQDGVDELLHRLEAELPAQPRAWALCETYLAYFSWWFRPIKRDELIDEVLSPIYKYASDPSSIEGYRSGARCPHLLATLFFVFAVGALVDLTLEPCSVEAEKYYRMGRAALSLKSIFDAPDMETIQAIALMSAYHSLCSTRHTSESAWALISLAARLSHSVGLHRDSAKWGLEHRIVERRRNLFWEVYLFEGTHCNLLGRPPGLSRMHTDCELPADEEQGMDNDGKPVEGYWHYKLRFQQSVVNHAYDILLNTETPQYEVILNLDRQLRQITVPNAKLFPKPCDQEYRNAGLCMQGCLMSQIRSIAVMSIHRTYFTQALLDQPSNPLKSPYAPSFLAAMRCASIVIKSFLYHYERAPTLYARFWSMWTHAFTACVILGSTIARCPTTSMAPDALIELDQAVNMFRRGAKDSVRAREALPMLENLRNRASHSYQQYRDRHILPSPDVPQDFGPNDQDGDNKLAMFGGKVRILSNGFAEWSGSKRTSPRRSSPSSDSHGIPSPGSEGASSSQSDGSLSHDMRQPFDMREYMHSSDGMSHHSRPLIVPSMAGFSSAAGPSHFASSSSTISSFSTQYAYSQAGASNYTNTHHSSNIPSSQVYGVPNHQLQGSTYSTSGDVSVDSTAWYAAVSGTAISDFGGETSPYVGTHAVPNQQWMYLMRDSGMFEHQPALRRRRNQPGGNNQPESIPESVNMIY